MAQSIVNFLAGVCDVATALFQEVLGNNDANKPLAERLYDDRKPDAGRLAKAGVDILVAGSAVFRAEDPAAAVTALREG